MEELFRIISNWNSFDELGTYFLVPSMIDCFYGVFMRRAIEGGYYDCYRVFDSLLLVYYHAITIIPTKVERVGSL